MNLTPQQQDELRAEAIECCRQQWSQIGSQGVKAEEEAHRKFDRMARFLESVAADLRLENNRQRLTCHERRVFHLREKRTA